MEGVNITLAPIHQKTAQFHLSATTLALPKPFNELALADIYCRQVTWSATGLDCQQGRASVHSAFWQAFQTDFSLHLSPQHSHLRVDNAQIDGSQIVFVITANGNHWQCDLAARQINPRLLERLLRLVSPTLKLPQFKQNGLAVKLAALGRATNLEKLDLTVSTQDLISQTSDGKLAVENADVQFRLNASRANNGWDWRSEGKMSGGGLYVDPVYVEAKAQPLAFNAEGWLDGGKLAVDIRSFAFVHPDVGRLTGSASAKFHQHWVIDQADVEVESQTLQAALDTYITPFFAESPFAGMTVAGAVKTHLKFVQQALTAAALDFKGLNIGDNAGRIALKDGGGNINWSEDPRQTRHSVLAWQTLALKSLPFAAANLHFTSRGNAFQLAQKVKLSVLDGTLAVDKFRWEGKRGDEPDVSFAGSLDKLSLAALSKTLGWTPLSGSISGQIPGVDYQNKVLSLGGELVIKVFDGTVKISHLTSSGLFSAWPRLESEIELDNLDLEQLTGKFEFGTITGRLSGFVKKLLLENWHPVTFYAWFGTPEDDDSSHRISQKAVQNIASIGGGGASDILSRGFLSLFDTFRYDQIGMGCYLHNGACQLMGLEAAGSGYYLIKGGLLPRIDVLGYNPKVNWDVLVERLKRVAAPEQAIIK